MLRFVILFTAVVISRCDATFMREDARVLQSDAIVDDIILTDPELTTLANAFNAANLFGKLCTVNCNVTVFAPNNEAFADFDQDFLATLLTPSWILHLQNLLFFHVTIPTAAGRLLSTDYTDGLVFEMLNNEEVTSNVGKRAITLTSPLTLGSDIVDADIDASNGIVQKVDSVFSPNFFGVDLFALGDEFVEFSILQEFIGLIGLSGTPGEFTVLAPINAAFEALGNETLDALRTDTGMLAAVLANHVIVGVYPSVVLSNGLTLEPFDGLNISVVIEGDVVMFNEATLLDADVLARNGIAHVIDTVILAPTIPSDAPSGMLSDVPSGAPSDVLSDAPSDTPSDMPSDMPSGMPSDVPSYAPSRMPSSAPSGRPAL